MVSHYAISPFTLERHKIVSALHVIPPPSWCLGSSSFLISASFFLPKGILSSLEVPIASYIVYLTTIDTSSLKKLPNIICSFTLSMLSRHKCIFGLFISSYKGLSFSPLRIFTCWHRGKNPFVSWQCFGDVWAGDWLESGCENFLSRASCLSGEREFQTQPLEVCSLVVWGTGTGVLASLDSCSCNSETWSLFCLSIHSFIHQLCMVTSIGPGDTLIIKTDIDPATPELIA